METIPQRTLLRLPHPEALAHVNAYVQTRREQAAIDGSLEAFYTQQESHLLEGLARLQKSLTDSRTQRILHTLTQKYRDAEEHLPPHASMDDRAAARINKDHFPDGLHVVSDLDNTMTEGSHYLLQAIPASAIAEPLLAQKGREHFPRVFVETWQRALAQYPKLYARGGKESYAPLRGGVDACFAYLKHIGAKRSILSANFEPFVKGVLSRIPSVDRNVDVFAVKKDDIRSTDKGTYLQLLARQNPSRALIYIGDGASDLPSLEAQSVVACYFALEGSVFAQELAKAHIPHFTYRDFHDIQLKLVHMQQYQPQKVAA